MQCGRPYSRLPAPRCLQWAIGLLVVTSFGANRPASEDRPLVVVVSADTEGHLEACQSCPVGAGFGGLARRATVLRHLRESAAERHEPVLLLDAGNAIFGPQSITTDGRSLVEAYDALGYDVVNISAKDFRLGKRQTLDLLARAKVAAVSASLEDAQTGKLLFASFVLCPLPDSKPLAVVGLTEKPPLLDSLPHLKAQLAGIAIRPPDVAAADAVRVARERGASDVIILYEGSLDGLTSVQKSVGGSVRAILVAGIRPERLPLPTGARPVVAAADDHGKALTRIRFGDHPAVEPIPIAPEVPPDPAMLALLKRVATAPASIPAPPPPIGTSR